MSSLRNFQTALKIFTSGKGISHDIIEAVLGGDLLSVPVLVDRANALQMKKAEKGFKEIIESLSRVMTIAKKWEGSMEIDPQLFENEYEQQLYDSWMHVVDTYAAADGQEAKFAALASLQPAISIYFDHTMVMAEQANVKMNRLAQMKQLANLIGSYAAINEIQVK
ncbi:hypothetical protein ACI2OX_09460 [Bacillus sp. N9]